MIKSKSEKVFNICNYAFMVLLILVFVLPYLLILTTSFTDESMIIINGPSLIIRKFSTASYVYLFSVQDKFLRAIFVSVYITALTTVFSIIVNSLIAFTLSRKNLIGRKYFNMFLVFTMLFSGGMIPGYLLITNLGLLNNLWAIILPAIANAWNIILIRNYFGAIPESLYESARIDGGTNLSILLKIYIPLSTAVIATIGLFTAVSQWNNWAAPLLYIDDTHKELYPIQYLIREMLNNLEAVMGEGGGGSNMLSESVKNAAVIIATLPIITLYPFVQKYFINGVIIGSVKE